MVLVEGGLWRRVSPCSEQLKLKFPFELKGGLMGFYWEGEGCRLLMLHMIILDARFSCMLIVQNDLIGDENMGGDMYSRQRALR